MNNHIDLTDEEIIQAYLEAGSSIKASKKLGISPWSVIHRVNSHGVPHASRDKYDREEIRQLWEKTGDLKEIERSLEIPHSYLQRILKELGIKVHYDGPNKYDLPMDELAERYMNGETCGEIARSLGIPSERIRRRLIIHGVKIRSAAESVPRGKKNVFYKNGEGDKKPMHYYRRQSYEVAAICLGQPLPRGCIIHHLDENAENNHPENLALFYSASDHTKHHMRLLRLLRKGKQVDATQLALESGAVRLPQPPARILLESDTDGLDPSSTGQMPALLQSKLIL